MKEINEALDVLEVLTDSDNINGFHKQIIKEVAGNIRRVASTPKIEDFSDEYLYNLREYLRAFADTYDKRGVTVGELVEYLDGLDIDTTPKSRDIHGAIRKLEQLTADMRHGGLVMALETIKRILLDG